MPNDIDELAVAELAAQAQVDRRSVRKALRGDHVRGLAGARISRAFAAFGVVLRDASNAPSPSAT